MNKFNKSQLLVLLVIILLLIITPFLPSSLKPTFLYFIFNLLIITLGAEAGLLSAFPRPNLEDKKFSASASIIAIPEKREGSTSSSGSSALELSENKPKIVVEKEKKCPSMPSLFLVEAKAELEAEAEAEDNDIGGINGQELFAKAETFIGNFYRQLKMQRD
ncbi:DUF4408 domain protein [Senna tora]|uniref:DUF4408 domain protein n=1 Tax=Senna tora TaxID=362788 RepID=A0A834T876_9FABA|nr:DUF4408 domain protein [Senna tora]